MSANGTEPLRVAIVSDATPERNGVGSYYVDLVSQLSERALHAELFCPRLEEIGWRRHLMPPLPGDRTQRLWIPRPFKLLRQVLASRPDAIIVPTPGPFGLIGLVAARRLRVPLIVGFHTHFEALAAIYWTRGFGKACQWVLEWCNRQLISESAVVLANSPDMERLASKLGARVVRRMGTSVAREFIDRPLVPPRAALERLLFAGRLAGEKNIPEIIRLAEAMPEVVVSIAGDGPLRRTVARAAARVPNLDYLGWVSRKQLVDVIDAHDLLLLPSRVESFGTVALEAMARGRPVVVSAACGIADWPGMQPGLFCIGADESLAEAVARIRALPDSARAHRAASARKAAVELNEWNLENWIERLTPRDAAHEGHEQRA